MNCSWSGPLPRLAADQVEHLVALPGRDAHVALDRFGFHWLTSPAPIGAPSRRSAVAAEHPRRRELAELVAHHVLRDVDRDELVAVVHGERVADELRRDRAAARPGLEHVLLAAAVHRLDLLARAMSTTYGPFFDRSRHGSPSPSCLLLPPPHDELVAQLALAGLVALGRSCPTACTGGGRRESCLRRRPSGGRPGSSPRRARCGRCRASACGPPCR